MKNLVQKGMIISHVATVAVLSGALVRINNLVGVAANDAEIGETVEVQIEDVFEVAKDTGAGTGTTVGQAVNYVFATNSITGATPGAGLGLLNIGTAFNSSADGNALGSVKLSGQNAVAS